MPFASYIRPIVEYVSAVRDPHTKRNTDKAEMVQRRCVCYVTGNFDRTSRVTSLLNSLIWPTLEERRRQYHLAVMYRTHRNQADIHWQSFLPQSSSFIRAHSCRLFVQFCKDHDYASCFFRALAKTGITLPSIQLTHHPVTSLSGSRGMKKHRLFFSFLCHVLFCPHTPATNTVGLFSDF